MDRIERRAVLLLTILVLVAAACQRTSATLSDADRELARAVGIDEAGLLAIKQAGKNLRRLEGLDDAGEPFPANGVTIDVGEDDALPTVRRLREELGPGRLVFVSERNYGIEPDRVSVLVADDPYDALRTMGTNGWNYDIGPDAIVERLGRWDAEFGLDIHGVGFDWLEASFERPPADMDRFAREVYEFCPDVVDQGTETVEALAREMARTNTLYLWWD